MNGEEKGIRLKWGMRLDLDCSIPYKGEDTMRKVLVALLSIMFLLAGATLWAQEDTHGRSLDYIIGEIKAEQEVQDIASIDPDQVAPALLTELGDAVMGLIFPDDAQHEWMDRMWGGEGFEELASTHRWIAYNYLLNDGRIRSWGPGMMGFGNRGSWMGGNWSHGWRDYAPWSATDYPQNDTWAVRYDSNELSGWKNNWWGWFLAILLTISIIVVVVLLILSHKKQPYQTSEAVTILKRRYAEGKLSPEEFHRMMKELQE